MGDVLSIGTSLLSNSSSDVGQCCPHDMGGLLESHGNMQTRSPGPEGNFSLTIVKFYILRKKHNNVIKEKLLM